MCAREVFLGTHIYIVGVDAGGSGDADGARWKSGVEVGVVGRGEVQVRVGDAAEREVLQGELHGGVGLQGDAGTQAVDVESCHHRLLLPVVRFFLYDGGQGGHFGGCHAQRIGLGSSGRVPETVVLFRHTSKEVFCIHIPVDLVGFGDEQAGQRLGRVALAAPAGGVAQGLHDFCRVYHQLVAHVAGQPVQRAHAADDQIHRLLVAAQEAAEDMVGVIVRQDGVAAGLNVLRVLFQAGCPAQAGQIAGRGGLAQFVVYGVGRVVAVYVDVDFLFRVELGFFVMKLYVFFPQR